MRQKKTLENWTFFINYAAGYYPIIWYVFSFVLISGPLYECSPIISLVRQIDEFKSKINKIFRAISTLLDGKSTPLFLERKTHQIYFHHPQYPLSLGEITLATYSHEIVLLAYPSSTRDFFVPKSIFEYQCTFV
jgi:hypothetical protein